MRTPWAGSGPGGVKASAVPTFGARGAEGSLGGRPELRWRPGQGDMEAELTRAAVGFQDLSLNKLATSLGASG